MNKKKNILLAVTGLSPQIVTETVFALSVAREQAGQTPWLPEEIHVITTAEGAQRAHLALLEHGKNWFGRLRQDYEIPDIVFGDEQIHIVEDSNGQPLDDIRNPANNERVADFICDTVRRLTANDDTALHVSIAGGRKTMGYYAGYALSLFGRPQDVLSHVLVSEPFESSWDFFYPTPYSEIIETRDKALADTRDARVTLAEIPFVRLRDELPLRLRVQEGKASFSETVRAAQKTTEPPELIIDLTSQRATASGEPLHMEPAELAFYAMMARAKQKGLHAQRHDSDGLAQRYLIEYGKLVKEASGDYERIEKALDSDDLKDWFDQRKSRTNTAIKNSLGHSLAQHYLITASGKRPKTRYSLPLPTEAIHFENGKLAGADKVKEKRQD